MVRNVLQFQGGVIFLLKSANLKIIQQIEENVSSHVEEGGESMMIKITSFYMMGFFLSMQKISV
jgi:hypothetical protein